mmetsp:Transcript_23366/g.34186  ORF Transcript_23366/g.34186 Transcript_23366/m.34186 type:complete len:105 (-) Transcript_23366:394-708(-)
MTPNRCVTINILFVFSIAFPNASTTFFSLSESRAAVGSSRRSTSGLRIRALAMATRCLWPPDSVLPPSPTLVSSSSPKLVLAASFNGRPAISNASDTAVRQVSL